MPPRRESERAGEQRGKKLEQVREQLCNGSLSVRRMTPEERARFAARVGSSAASG